MSGKKTLLASSIGVCTASVASVATAAAWASGTDSHPVVADVLTSAKAGERVSLDARETLYQSGKQLTISIGNTFAYEVKKGDSLYQIGLQHGVHYQELAKLNNIDNPRKLVVGTVLKIPLNLKEITAKGGEQVYPLCREYGMSLQLFLRLNPDIQFFSPLEPGQKIKVVEKSKHPVSQLPTSKPVEKEQPHPKLKNKVVMVSKREKICLGSFQFQWPISGIITSPFGWRHGRMHKGLDISNALKSKQVIHASLAGTVIGAGYHHGYGNLVMIDHGGGWVTYYAHLSRITVSVGQKVDTGQALGLMGETGDATGYHVHFEVHKDGVAINPLRVLRR